MNSRNVAIAVMLTSLCVSASMVQAQGNLNHEEGIGVFTAVQGAVTVVHPRIARAQPVNVHDEVLFKDVIETQNESRTKAFFEDDSVLTVGENSRVEVTEYIYNPDENVRRMVVKLVNGKLRALVSKVFKGSGSKFEIHTPTAVAAARGTYFVVWTENGTTGIVNIGESGLVDFTSGGQTVTVAPGKYSVVAPGGVPAPPLVYDMGSNERGGPVARADKTTALMVPEKVVAQTGGRIGSLYGNTTDTLGTTLSTTVGTVDNLIDQSVDLIASVFNAIEGTVLKDMPKPESALEALRALLPAVPTIPVAVSGIVNTAAGSTTALIGQVTPATSSALVGSVASVASVASPVTSALSTTLAPVTSTVSTILAPVTSVVSTTLAPVTSTVSTILAPVTPVLSPILAPVAPVLSPILAPVTPVLSPILAPVVSVVPVVPVTPPAVISGVTGALGLSIKK